MELYLDTKQSGLGESHSNTTTVELHLNTKLSGLAGAVYTRWGRTECPSYSTTLYQGLMAGSHYQHKGSGGNHLCLPLNPQWNKTFGGHKSEPYLYGSEFELYNTNPVFHQTNSGGDFFHQRDIQCAVCYTPGRPSHVMIPARLECPIGWTVEYLGFLMAAHYSHRRSEYVCVDQDPDTHPGTAKNVNSNLLYIVEDVCGPLPCPNYVDGYEVTCVVCTK
ncbi:short-chain collagen C4-like [Liolophura sinensis]|uniref:short-chain collagen C4-like n=1 Tax=Liolophura sinensis TaxID=3198878 RepID=UPI0031584BF7